LTKFYHENKFVGNFDLSKDFTEKYKLLISLIMDHQ